MSDACLLPDRYKLTTPATLYIFRHGETDLNKYGIVQGRGMDTDLNARGQLQAQAFYEAYRHVPFDRIYTSSLKRTHQTVKPFIEAGIPWTPLAELDELSWGIYEGLDSLRVSAALKKIIIQWGKGALYDKFEQGESPLEVKERQLAALQHLKAKSQDKQILICMHGRAMRLFLCLLTEIPLSKMEQFPHSNTSLYIVNYDGQRFQIVEFNNLDHLKMIC